MPQVFISYRRDDAITSAGRLADRLTRELGPDSVFLDTESIAPGAAFPAVLRERLAQAEVVVVVIGPRWASIADDSGRPRLHDPDDFVALEVATALERDVRVIPVLVGGATMPAAELLPPRLRALTERNAVPIDDRRFAQDCDNLLDAIHGRARGFARRELDRLRRLVHVAKISSIVAPLSGAALLFAAWTQLFDVLSLDTKIASYTMWLGEQVARADAAQPIVLVGIDSATEQQLGRELTGSSEWRSDHARLIERVSAAGTRAIVFDLFFERSTDADAQLVSAIKTARARGTRVVVGHRRLVEDQPLVVASLLNAGAEAGALCIQRRLSYAYTVPLLSFLERGDELGARNGTQAISLVANVSARSFAPELERGSIVASNVTSGDAGVRFIGYSTLERQASPAGECAALAQGDTLANRWIRLSPPGHWRAPNRYASYADALTGRSLPALDRLSGAIVLVGLMVERGGDVRTVTRGFTRSSVFGVEIQADAIAEIARGRPLRPFGAITQWSIMIALTLVGAAFSFYAATRSKRWRWTVAGFALVGYLGWVLLCYVGFDRLANVLYEMAAFVTGYSILARVQKRANARQS